MRERHIRQAKRSSSFIQSAALQHWAGLGISSLRMPLCAQIAPATLSHARCAPWRRAAARRAACARSMLLQHARGVCLALVATGENRSAKDEWAPGALSPPPRYIQGIFLRLSASLRAARGCMDYRTSLGHPERLRPPFSPPASPSPSPPPTCSPRLSKPPLSSPPVLGCSALALWPPPRATRIVRVAWGACSAAFGVLVRTRKAAHAAPLQHCPPRRLH